MNDSDSSAPTPHLDAPTPGASANDASGRDLSDAQRRAAELLAQGHQDVEVARQVGRHPQTVRRWKEDPAVSKAIATAGERIDASLREQMGVLSAKLIESKLRAVDALVAQLDADDPNVVVKSAETLLKA